MTSQPYDILGRRTAQTREDGITESYAYDLTGQLTGVDYGTVGAGLPRDGLPQNETFAYDAVGNRLEVGLEKGVMLYLLPH